jgi:Fe-S cluster biosynthesis and repair protein YggX
MQLSQEKFSQISKAYLVRWKKFRIFVVWDTQINFMNKQFRARLLSVVN